jgi:hypothetical protein
LKLSAGRHSIETFSRTPQVEVIDMYRQSTLLILCALLIAGARTSGRAVQPATPRSLRVIAFGAHPDDAEL